LYQPNSEKATFQNKVVSNKIGVADTFLCGVAALILDIYFFIIFYLIVSLPKNNLY